MSFRNHVINLDHVAFVFTQNSRKPSNVGRVEKWRDLQRTLGQLRQLDESPITGRSIFSIFWYGLLTLELTNHH